MNIAEYFEHDGYGQEACHEPWEVSRPLELLCRYSCNWQAILMYFLMPGKAEMKN